TNAALGRAWSTVVMHAIAGEHLDRAIVHLNREVHDRLPVAVGENPAHVLAEIDDIGGDIELLDGYVKEAGFGVGFYRESHAFRNPSQLKSGPNVWPASNSILVFQYPRQLGANDVGIARAAQPPHGLANEEANRLLTARLVVRNGVRIVGHNLGRDLLDQPGIADLRKAARFDDLSRRLAARRRLGKDLLRRPQGDRAVPHEPDHLGNRLRLQVQGREATRATR